jgi:hypothetical protein
LPFPAAPTNLFSATRRRVHEREIRQRVVFGAGVGASAVLLLLVLIVLTGRDASPPDTQLTALTPSGADAKSPALDTADLEALFAPPPVAPLAVLDRRQNASLRVLEQLERSR